MIFLIYLLKTILISGIFWLYFLAFLRNRNFHGFNRLYLLSGVALSLLIPLLHFSIPEFNRQHMATPVVRILSVAPGNWHEAGDGTVTGKMHATDWPLIVASAYAFFVLAFLWTTIRSWRKIAELIRLHPGIPVAGLTCHATKERSAPFSFFRHIFWKGEFHADDLCKDPVFIHEAFHAHAGHSIDRLYMELISGLFWINPFFRLMKKELKAVHEFQADAGAIYLTDRFRYAEFLLLPLENPVHGSLSITFFTPPIKRRINMIMQNHIPHRFKTSRLMILPVVILIAGFFAFTVRNDGHARIFHGGRIKVIIDPGHGGKFDGAISADKRFIEKDIVLQISKKIAELAPSYQIDVVLSRDKDQNAGNEADISRELDYRAGLAAKNGAQAFVSIHLNQEEDGKTSQNGIEAYIAKNTVTPRSGLLASTILSKMSADYKTDTAIKQPATGVRVLDHNTVPATIIECGYLSNETDLAFITNPANQEKIARDILAGIAAFGQAGEPVSATGTDTATISIAKFKTIPPVDIDSISVDKISERMVLIMKDGRVFKVAWSKIQEQGPLDFRARKVSLTYDSMTMVASRVIVR